LTCWNTNGKQAIPEESNMSVVTDPLNAYSALRSAALCNAVDASCSEKIVIVESDDEDTIVLGGASNWLDPNAFARPLGGENRPPGELCCLENFQK
jgi:hypothetical protein